MPTRLELAEAAQQGNAQLDALVCSLPHLARLVGEIIVIKIGGSLGQEGTVLEDVILLQRLGVLEGMPGPLLPGFVILSYSTVLADDVQEVRQLMPHVQFREALRMSL